MSDDDYEAKPSEEDEYQDQLYDEIEEGALSADVDDVNREGRGTAPAEKLTNPNAIALFSFSKQATRAYEGPLRKQRQAPVIIDFMFGPEESHVDVAIHMLDRFYLDDVTPSPPVNETSGPIPSPWLVSGFEETQKENWIRWYQRYLEGLGGSTRQHWPPVDEEVQLYLPGAEGDLAMMYGPYGDQLETMFRKNKFESITLASYDMPPTDKNPATGWVIETSGIVLSLAWAPLPSTGEQVLGVCVVPFSDQEHPKMAEGKSHKESRKHGIIQLWRFPSVSGEFGVSKPATEKPTMFRALCFDWGRARRVKWCPVPSTHEGLLGLLAVLTGDGVVRVLEVSPPRPDEVTNFSKHSLYIEISKLLTDSLEKLDSSIFTLDIPQEQGVKATAFAWVNINRIVIGYTDGSLALWSLHPQIMLSRHPIHTTYVLELATGYPSQPYLVASTSTNGLPTLVDMTCPSYETTSFTRNVITTQPNLLQWNELMQGFLICNPSGSVVETAVSFVHHRYFPVIKRIIDTPSLLTCLASGYTHPYLLVGLKDGSVWSCNAMKKAFATKIEKPKKQKILHHEYKPAVHFHNPEINKTKDAKLVEKHEPVRGAARILQGWRLEDNKYKYDNTTRGKPSFQRPPPRPVPKQKKAAVIPQNNNPAEEAEEVEDEEEGERSSSEEVDDLAMFPDPRPLVSHEPLTRITAMEWNPNLDCASWAAIGMASGLVRVVDLGTKREDE
jgi:transcription factor C subunit 6